MFVGRIGEAESFSLEYDVLTELTVGVLKSREGNIESWDEAERRVTFFCR